MQTFILSRASDRPADSLGSIFDQLESDPYCREGIRYRALNQYCYRGGQVTVVPTRPFFQDERINRHCGGMVRHFPAVELGGSADGFVRSTIAQIIDCCGLGGAAVDVGAHFIRTVCGEGASGVPAPEGVHQDGFDFIAILCVQRDRNIHGARSFLYEDDRGERAVFERELVSGDLVVINDRRLFHYTTAFTPVEPQPARLARDVVVFTFQRTGEEA